MRPTSEEILKETSYKQLDKWAAEYIMGWPYWDFASGEDWDGRYPMFTELGEDIYLYKSVVDMEVWSPSRSISTAWQIKHEITKSGEWGFAFYNDGNGYCMSSFRYGLVTFEAEGNGKSIDEAETICRAALLAAVNLICTGMIDENTTITVESEP